MLRFVPFQLPVASDSPPEGEGWLREIKYDGYRTQFILENGTARAFTRNGYDWTERYKPLAAAVETLPCDSAILDGEVVVLNADGKPDFGALQRSTGKSVEGLAFVAFDLLHRDGVDLRRHPLIERKQALEGLLPRLSPRLRHCEHLEIDGKSFFSAVDAMNLEGMVSKRLDSRYKSGRSATWIKTKCYQTSVFGLAGTATGKNGEPIALLADRSTGAYSGSAILTLGRQQRERLRKQIERFREERPRVPISRVKNVTWVAPGINVRVKHLKGEARLRHATITALDEDDEGSVRLE